MEIPYRFGSIFATKIDFFAVLAIFVASIILCCSIRVSNLLFSQYSSFENFLKMSIDNFKTDKIEINVRRRV